MSRQNRFNGGSEDAETNSACSKVEVNWRLLADRRKKVSPAKEVVERINSNMQMTI